MKTAVELYEISKTKASEIVEDILKGVREHIIQRCEEEANKGATYYSIYLKRGLSFTKTLLLGECIKLVKEFEDNGYKISIEDTGNGYYVDFAMRFSWNDRLVEFNDRSFGYNELLYTTDDGLVTDELRVSWKEVRLKIIKELRNLFLEVLGLAEVMLENNEKEEYINEFDKIVKRGEM